MYAHQPQPVSAPTPRVAELVLEHALGYTARPNNLVFCGSLSTDVGRRGGESAPTIAYGCGKLVVLSNLNDPHDQRLLRGFDAPITCLDSAFLSVQNINVNSNSSGLRIGEGRINVIATGHAASPDGVCYVNFWDAGSGALIKTIATAHKFMATAVTSGNSGNAPVGGGTITSVKFSPDGLMFATTGSDGSVSVMECAGASRIGYFKDTIANDEANAILWSSVRNSGTRDQQYIFVVPFTTGVRMFTLQFNVRTLNYDMRCDPCQAPGGGGRTGGFQRRYLCIAQLGDDLLCGCSNGEVVVFNAVHGNFRACLTTCHGGITGVVACPLYGCAFVCGADGSVRRLSGRDTEWRMAGEVFLPSSSSGEPTRCVSMAINADSCADAVGSASGDQLVISTTSGIMYRMLCSDMTFSSAKEGPLRAVTAIAAKDVTQSSASSSQPPFSASAVVATCSADGAVRLWSLDDYQAIGTFTGALPHAESSAAHPAQFANTGHHNAGNVNRTQQGIGGAGQGFQGTSGGRAMGSRFGSDNNGGGVTAVNYQSGHTTSTISGGVTHSNTGGGSGADVSAVTVVPLCASFDSRPNGDSDSSSFMLVTGWSDGRVRCIDFTESVRRFFSHPSAGGGLSNAVTPTLAYEISSAHRGAVTSIDVCSDYLVTGGHDTVVRVWSNPAPLTPQQIHELQASTHAPNNGHQLAHMPYSHHQQRVVLTEINAHRGPITAVRIDNASSVLLHTSSADMSHKVFDLQHLAGGSAFQNNTNNNYNNNTLPGGYAGVNNMNNARGGGAVSNNTMPPKMVRSHDVSHCSGFLAMSQRVDREHEIVVGTGDGQLLFFDIDVGAKPVAAIVDKNRIPVVAVDVWNSINNHSQQQQQQQPSSSSADHQRLAVGLADGSVLIYSLSQGVPSQQQQQPAPQAGGGRGGRGGGGYDTYNDFNRSQYNSSNPNTANNNLQGSVEQGVALVFHALCHTGAVTSVKWSPDGRQLFTAGAQGEFYVWDYFVQ